MTVKVLASIQLVATSVHAPRKDTDCLKTENHVKVCLMMCIPTIMFDVT